MAKVALRRSNTLIGTMLMHMGDADALLCGTVGRFEAHLEHVRDVIGLAPGAKVFAAMNALMLENIRCSSPTPSSMTIPPPTNWPRSRNWPLRKSRVSASFPRSR